MATVMSKQAILRNAVRYIGILTQTLHESDRINGIAEQMIQNDIPEAASTFLREETKSQQEILDRRVRNQFIFYYGNADPSKTPIASLRASTTLDDIIETLEASNYVGNPRRKDSLGMANNPVILGKKHFDNDSM